MNPKVKEEFLHVFGISLALVASATLIFMSRSPSLTGYAVLSNDATSNLFIIGILILAGLAVVLGAIVVIFKLKKEAESHKKAIGENKTPLVDPSCNDLMSYIIQAKEHGFTPKQITDRLKKDKWNPRDIEKCLLVDQKN